MFSTTMKLPTNYFMHWFREKIDAKTINLKFHFKDIEDNDQYLDDFIADKIDNWTSDVPVIISAQTGSGKNHFIQQTLLPKLIEENPDQNDLILILSNRIALNRQTKYKLAELLVEYKHNAKYLTEIERFFKPEGVDYFYQNFDVVTVCSYHQLYERCVLSQKDLEDSYRHPKIDISKFKYIICDECHFFTSDASFNENTFDILELIVSQGQNAIRIYMSATPEVAFESILQTEFDFRQEHLKQKINDKKTKLKNDVQSVQFLKNLGFKKKELGKDIRKEFKNNKKILKNIEEVQENFDKYFNFSVDFYYLARNYDYVVPHVYKDNEELVDIIKNSDSKWLIFSNSDVEKNFLPLLKSANIDSIFLSRDGIEKNEKIKTAYDYIIEHETTDKKILISTSLLDNGINITNSTIKKYSDKILNIAIDSFDRVQFLQMLGRIRREEGVFVQLYIREYSMNRIKNLLRLDSELLVKMLAKKIWNVTFFDDKRLPKFFNPCAIIQLINRMSILLSLIRREESDFCIKFSNPELEAYKGRIYDFYKNGFENETFWSRLIVDLLESSREMTKRIEYINDDIDNGEDDVTRHESKLTDTFMSWLYRLMSSRYESDLEEKFFYYEDMLDDPEYNHFQHILNNHTEDISTVEKIELLQKHFDFKAKDVFINIDLVKKLNDKAIYYKNLVDIMCSGTPLQEQLSWIEKSLDDLPSDNIDEIISTVEETKTEITLEEYILAHHVTEHDIALKKTGKYFDEKFLNQSGILKGSDNEKSLANQYFQGTLLTKMLNTKWTISDSQYTLLSFNDNSSSHKTYYCFVKEETKSD